MKRIPYLSIWTTLVCTTYLAYYMAIPFPSNCPPSNTTTFSTVLQPADELHIDIAAAGQVDANGEYAILGYKEKGQPNTFLSNLVFAKLDMQGNYVLPPVELQFTTFAEINLFTNTSIFGLQLLEAPDGSGDYLGLGTYQDAGPQRKVLYFRINASGTVLWAGELDGNVSPDRFGRGLHYNSFDNTYSAVVQGGSSGNSVEIFSVQDSFCMGSVEHFISDYPLTVSASTTLSGMANPEARFAITGNSGFNGNFLYVMLLNQALQPIAFAPLYDLDQNVDSQEVPMDIQQDGDFLVITGNMAQGEGGTLFILKTQPFDNLGNATGNVVFAKSYNVPDAVSPGLEADVAQSLVVLPNSEYAVAGFINQGGGSLEALALKVQSDGIPIWVKRYTDPAYGNSAAFHLEATADGGLFITGEQYVFGTTNVKIWAAKIDSKGQLANCDCYQEATVEQRDLMAEFESFPVVSNNLECTINPMAFANPALATDQDFCDQSEPVEELVISCPPAITLPCIDDYTDPANTNGQATTIGGCDPIQISFMDVIISSDPCNAIIERKWLAMDNCGQQDSCTQTINLVDEVPPVIMECPDDVVIQWPPDAMGECILQTDLPLPVAEDDCNDLVLSYVLSGATTGSGTDANLNVALNQGITTVTWTIMDSCGNSMICEYTINYICLSNSCPTCPDNLVANSDFQQGNTNWLSNTNSPQFIDGDFCGDPGALQIWGNRDVGESVRQTGINFEQGKTYSISFCARFLPQSSTTTPYVQAGFTASNGFVNPFNDPAAYNIGATAATPNDPVLPYIDQTAWMCFSLPDWTANQDYTDLIINAFNSIPDSQGGGAIVSWLRIDNICIQEVDVPCTFTCPTNINEPNDPARCEAMVTVPPPDLMGDCTNCVLTNDFNGSADASGTYPVGCTTVTWRLDCDGGLQTCSIEVCVEDVEPPTISDCGGTITEQGIDDGMGTCSAFVTVPLPIATDNCSAISYSYILTGATTGSGTNDASGTYNVGFTTINWTLTDDDGNTSTCTTEVEVLACEGCTPLINCPADTVISCCGMVELPDPIIVDACGLDTIICVREDGLGLEEPFPTGTTCITCSAYASDDLINPITDCTYCVTVENDPPELICPDSLVYVIEDSCKLILPDLTDQVIVFDSCQGQPTCAAIGAGVHYSFYSRGDGDFYVWGVNTARNELGLGPVSDQLTPQLSPFLQNVIAIDGSIANGLAVQADGTLWSWGENSTGITGLGVFTGNTSTPTQVVGSNWEQVTVSFNTAFAIKDDGSLWSWGLNSNGALGLGNTTDFATPQQVQPGTQWLEVKASGDNTIALRSDRTLWQWGSGILSPQQVGTDSDWRAINASTTTGSYFALKLNGTLWAWGQNSGGELGVGVQGPVSNPTQVGTDTDWSCVRGGGGYTQAVKTNGTLWGWGSANLIGIGQSQAGQNFLTPQQIGTDTDWTCCLAIGGDHTLASKTDGSLWAWGLNVGGSLGIGQQGSSSSIFYDPVLVLLPAPTNSGSLVITQNPPAGTCLEGGTHNVEIIADDLCGGLDTCIIEVIIQCDTTCMPTLVCPMDITVPNDPELCRAMVNIPLPTVGGDCTDCTLTNDYNGSADASDIYPVGCTTVNWTLDCPDADDPVRCSMLVCVEDVEAPNVSCTDVSVDVSNGPGSIQASNVGTASDNCGIVSETIDINTFDCTAACGTVQVTYTATDPAGLSSSCTANVLVEEFENPIITCPPNITIECNLDEDDLSLTGQATAVDNCTANPDITSSDFSMVSLPCEEVIERTWVAVDDCGLMSTCVQMINKVDDTPPVLTDCPGGMTIQQAPDAMGDCLLTTDLPLPTANDRCNQVSFSYVLSGATTGTGTDANTSVVLNQGSTIVTWTISDICGNSITCEYRINFICISDSCPECLGNLVVNSDFQQGDANWIANTNSPQYPTTDYCGDPGAVQMWGNQDVGESIRQTGINFEQGKTYSISFCARFLPQSTTTTPYVQIGFTASNGALNPFTNANAYNMGTTAATPNNPNLPYIDQTDWMCYTIPNWTATQDYSNLIINVFNSIPDNQGGGAIVSWARIDNICIQEVLVNCDLVCPDDVTVPNDPDICGALVNVPMPDLVGECTGCTVTNNQNGGPNASGFYPVGCTTVIWTLDCGTGLQPSCSIEVCVEDVEAPSVSCLDISVDVSNGPVVIQPAAIGTATDNCGIVSETLDINTFDCPDACGTVQVTYTATDAAGLSSSCTANVLVEEFENPVITCPPNITIECNLDEDDLSLTGQATAVDNCTANPDITSSDFSMVSLPCEEVIERTWVAVDDCGLMSTCVQMINKIDDTPPVLMDCPGDITIQQAPDAMGDCLLTTDLPLPTANDRCNQVSFSYVLSGATTGTGTDANTSVVLNQGSTIVTWTISDICGNSITCEYRINFICISNSCPECLDNLVVNSDFQQGDANWIANTNSPQYPTTDYCGDPGAVQMWGNQDVGESIRQAGINFEQGKTYSISFCARFLPQSTTTTPYVQIGFTASNGALNPFTNANAYNMGTTAATPNNPNLPYINQTDWMCYTISNWTATQDYSDLIINVFNSIPDNQGGGAIVSWARIDNICIQEVELNCELVCPNDISVTNDPGTCQALVNVPMPDLVGDCTGCTVTNNLTNGPSASGFYPVGCTTVIWTLDCNNGLAPSCSMEVCVEDVEAPMVTCGSITIDVSNGPVTIAPSDIGSATDNCGVVLETLSQTTFNCSNACTGVPVQYTAQDAAGFSTSCTGFVTINESTVPVFTNCPTDQTLQGMADNMGNCTLAFDLPIPTATDDCTSIFLNYTMTGATTGSGNANSVNVILNGGVTTVTWTATDLCGNSTMSCSYELTLECIPDCGNCENNIVQNGGFDPFGPGWQSNPTWNIYWGTPDISNDACEDPNSIQMWGYGSSGEAIMQQNVNFVAGTTYRVSFCARFVDLPNFGTNYVRFGFNATDNPISYFPWTSGSNIGATGNISNENWACYSLPLWTPNQNYQHLMIHVFNNIGGSSGSNSSWGRIDNICIEPVQVVCEADFSWQAQNDCGSIQFTDLASANVGNITSWEWSEVGQGSFSTQQNPVHSLSNGPHTICLTINTDMGCVAQYCENLTVNADEVAPTITCANARTLVCPDDPTALNFVDLPTVSDNVDPFPFVSYSDNMVSTDPCNQLIDRIWSATDNCGNTNTCTQVIAVIDNEPPTLISCPADVIVQGVSSDFFPCQAFANVPLPVVDDCNPNVTFGYSLSGATTGSGTGSPSFAFGVGLTTITWTATDICGNSAILCNSSVNVLPCAPCTITCPANITVPNDPGLCEAFVAVSSPTLDGDCFGCTITNDYTGTDDASANYPVGCTTVIWTFDNCTNVGNRSCSMVICVEDVEPMDISCPFNVTATDNTGAGGAIATWPLNVTDNCPVDISCTISSGSFFPCGITPVVCTLTESSTGNTFDCAFNVSVLCVNSTCGSCPNTIVQNGDFQAGAVAGDLDLNGTGNVNNWQDNTRSPQVVTNDFCGDPVSIQMWGNRNTGESIVQNGVNIQAGVTYSISFCARFLPMFNLQANYVQFGFTAANGFVNPHINGGNIGATAIGQINSTNWTCYTIPNWTADQDYTDLIVHAFNNIPNISSNNTTVSWGRIDNICIEPVNGCTADFSWQPATTPFCGSAQLLDQSTSTGSTIFNWDWFVDGVQISTGQNPNVSYTFPASGTYNVCVSIDDQLGCSDIYCEDLMISYPDGPPTIVCPDDQVFPTDPGDCFSTMLPPDAMIGQLNPCDPSFAISCERDDGFPLTDPYPVGVTTIICRSSNSFGVDSCIYTVTVEDNEPPFEPCPGDFNVTVTGGSTGAIVNFFLAKADNCGAGQVSIQPTSPAPNASGDFFPLGCTTVSYQAIDGSLNVSACSFDVCVEEDCGNCSDVASDVAAGFTVSQPYGGGSCVRRFTPNQLGPCDEVQWLIAPSTGANPFSMGNDFVDVVLNDETVYKITILVIRVLPDGTVCDTMMYVHPPFYVDCNPGPAEFCLPMINQNFEEGLVGWQTLLGFPAASAEMGCDDPGYAILSGNRDVTDIIGQALEGLPPNEETDFLLHLCLQAPLQGEIRPGTRLVIRTANSLQVGQACEGQCNVIGVIDFDEAGDWLSPDPIYAEALMDHVFFHIESDWPNDGSVESLSYIGLDNICLEAIPQQVTSVEVLFFDKQVEVFPNPTSGAFQVRFSRLPTQLVQYRIFDLWGRPLERGVLESGALTHELSLDRVASGVYVLELRDALGGVFWMKMVKVGS